jgi:para-nitrobenzyl esterase
LITVSTPDGELQGLRSGRAIEFCGIEFATADRFQAPVPVAPWQGTREALRYGPMCPQQEEGLELVLGTPPGVLEQSERCLNLSVTAPVPDGTLRPVMVWIHGGAYLIGSGSLAYYEAHRLVDECSVVVVRINFRLGAFGYLQLDGVSPANLGLLDQIAALAWVQRNIRAFGGDASRVTVFGQSAGADSVACLLESPAARPLFHRAILQSGPFGLRDRTPAYARKVAGYFVKALGADPKTASTEQLLKAQIATTAISGRRDGLRGAMPFGPVAGDALLPRDFCSSAYLPRDAATIQLMIGSTLDDITPFLYDKPVLTRLRSWPIAGTVIGAIAAGLTRHVFGAPARKMANRWQRAGARVYTYRFDWTAPSNLFGSCHCIELPFLLGDESSWRDAPMLSQGSWEEIEALGRQLRAAWASFASHGEPRSVEGAHWPLHEPGKRVSKLWGLRA